MARTDNPQPDYDTLLKLYGESMLRVEQLEARITSGGGGDGSTQGDFQARAISELTERVEALQGMVAGQSESAAASTDAQPTNDRTDEFAQMRLQITSLVNQLDVARNEIKDYRARRRRRSRAPEHTSWLQSFARRLGISRPQRF